MDLCKFEEDSLIYIVSSRQLAYIEERPYLKKLRKHVGTHVRDYCVCHVPSKATRYLRTYNQKVMDWPGMVVHAFYYSTWEAKAGRLLQVQVQSAQHSELYVARAT